LSSPRVTSVAQSRSAGKPYGPGTEQDEIVIGPATYVAMTNEEWDEAVDLLADILMPLFDRFEREGRLPKRPLPKAA
jgi:hypothetical protein